MLGQPIEANEIAREIRPASSIPQGVGWVEERNPAFTGKPGLLPA